MPDGGEEGFYFAPTFDTAKFSLPPIPDSRLLKVGVVMRWNNRQNEGGNRCMVYLYVGTLIRVILCNYFTSFILVSLKFSILDFQPNTLEYPRLVQVVQIVSLIFTFP